MFVSGAAGVIGSYLVPKLVAAGKEVLAGDLKPRPTHFPSSVNYLEGDLNLLAPEVLLDFQPDAFIHLAASFERSSESPGFWRENFANNVSLSHRLSSLAIASGSLKKLVNASSYLVYDRSQYFGQSKQVFALDEGCRIHPRNLIGSAKYFHELELEFLERTHGQPISITNARIFRGYGVGSRDVISRWVRSLLIGEQISVFGRDGSFDYVFAEDSAEGLIRIMENKKSPTTINLGSGVSRSIRDVLTILSEYFPSAAILDKSEEGELERSVADISLLEDTLGWRPVHSLEQGIEKIVRFEERHITLLNSNESGN